MKLSKKSEYACLAMIHLSESYGAGPVKIGEISKKNSIPKKYLEQILLLLKKEGYLKSRRGIEGGYVLSKKPCRISIAEIVRLIDGPLAPVNSASKYFYESTPLEQNSNMISIMKEIRGMIADRLENTTFADVAESGPRNCKSRKDYGQA